MDDIKGSGTEKNPYKIESFCQLQYINQELDACYKLISDIDANTKSEELGPIGRPKPFNGTFNGNNYKICNLRIKRPEQIDVGLFDRIDDDGRVKNLGLASSTIEGRSAVGSIVGLNYGKIESSYTKEGNVSGDVYVGGLVGKNGGKIESSCAFGDVSGVSEVGGLVGYNDTGEVKSSYVQRGDVSGGSAVGGLVGNNRIGEVESSHIQGGDVSGNRMVGGLVGSNQNGEVQSSYTVDNNVLGDANTGNLVGENFFGGQLESCFNMAELDNPNSLEEPDLVLSKENHRILYTVETNTLYLQVKDKIYSSENVSSAQVQSLVDNEREIEITDRFRSSVVSSM